MVRVCLFLLIFRDLVTRLPLVSVSAVELLLFTDSLLPGFFCTVLLESVLFLLSGFRFDGLGASVFALARGFLAADLSAIGEVV